MCTLLATGCNWCDGQNYHILYWHQLSVWQLSFDLHPTPFCNLPSNSMWPSSSRLVESLSRGKMLTRGLLTFPKPSVCGIVYLSDTNIWHIDNITVIRNAAVVWIKRKSVGEPIGADCEKSPSQHQHSPPCEFFHPPSDTGHKSLEAFSRSDLYPKVRRPSVLSSLEDHIKASSRFWLVVVWLLMLKAAQ